MFVLFLQLLLTRFSINDDLYSIAGIDYSASTEDIRKISKLYENETNSNFTQKKEAISILNSTYLRRIYDLYGIQGIENPKKFEGITTNFLSMHKYIPVLDFYEGRKYNFSITRRRICKCPHNGFMCTFCKGYTTIDETVHLQVNLNKGSADPFVYTFTNITDETPDSSPGNLKIVLKSLSTFFYSRSMNEIHVISLNHPRNLEIGKNISYYWIDNEVHYYKVSEIQNTYVVPGKGMPIEGTNEYGDLYIHMQA